MRDFRHPLRRGPKYGIARGVAVLAAPGGVDGGQELADLLGDHEALTEWMTASGADLEVSAAGLQAVEAMIDDWRDDPQVAPRLENEVGLFLGHVLVQEIAGARWHVWRNGHPVVRLTDRREFDVTALTSSRVRGGRPLLTAILSQARSAR